MHHQHRHRGIAQHVLGKAAENPFAETAVPIGAHYDKGALLGCGRQ